MNKLYFALGGVGLILVVAGAWFYMNWNTYAPETYVKESVTELGITTQTTVNTTTGTTTQGAPKYTQGDVASHKDATSCYTIINGSVYDLTMWVAVHPGGKKAILSLCGIDGTSRFTSQHSGDAKPMSVLARFKIGVVTQ